MEEEPEEEPEETTEDTTEDTEQDDDEEMDAGADEEEQETSEVEQTKNGVGGTWSVSFYQVSTVEEVILVGIC